MGDRIEAAAEAAVNELLDQRAGPLERIRWATAVMAATRRLLDANIAVARASGHTWDQIGAAMDMTGQAVGRRARSAGLGDQPRVRPESRRARRRRLAAAHGARMLRNRHGDVRLANEDFELFYGRPLPASAHTADPDSLPPGYARQRWPLNRAPAADQYD
jgi:hypothetical protein